MRGVRVDVGAEFWVLKNNRKNHKKQVFLKSEIRKTRGETQHNI